MKNRTVISICGGSGSGKSTLAKAIVEKLGPDKSIRIPTDYFLVSNDNVSPTEYFENTLRYDWELIEEILKQPNGSKISVPDFDFTTFKRKSLNSDWKITLREVIIIDSMIPYDKADLLIFMELDNSTRRERIIERDKKWETKVITNWDSHLRILSNLKARNLNYDLTLDSNNNIEENTQKVIELLRKHI